MKVLGKSRDWRDENRLKPPKQYTPNKNPLTQNEILKLFKHTENDYKQNAILKILYYGLLRRGELRNLNLKDIDYQRHKIRINAGKGNKYATINLHPDAVESIKRYLEFRDPKNPEENALFINDNRKRIGSTFLQNMLKRYALRCKIRDKRIYPLLMRITGITHLAQKGINLKIIQSQSRHSDIQTLLGYIQPTEEETKKEYFRGMSLGQNQHYVLDSQRSKPQKDSYEVENINRKAMIKSEKDTDKTDKYIALLQEGIISKDEFKKLMSNNNTEYQKSYIY